MLLNILVILFILSGIMALMIANTKHQQCNRCDKLFHESEIYCPGCGSCQQCGCCPCRKTDCSWCAECANCEVKLEGFDYQHRAHNYCSGNCREKGIEDDKKWDGE